MTIAVFGRNFSEDATQYIRELFEILHQNTISVFVFESFENFLIKKKVKTYASKVINGYDDLTDVDYFLSLGGDGTFLESVSHIRDREIPVLGINTGRLGFLATTPQQKIKEDIGLLLAGKFEIENRSLLSLDANKELFNEMNFALNEITIQKKDSSSMIVVHAFLNDKFLNSYWADGLIIATPTGSTAYALSCGGPVVMPSSTNFIIAPISPHNLNVRPLIVSDDCKLQFKIDSRSKNILISSDSRYKTVNADIVINISKQKYNAKILKIKGQDFLVTLRDKLNWGLDQRNY